jgi:hypothetical protein
MSYGAALALTLAIECPLYAFTLSRCTRCRPTGAAVRGLIVNLVSHPLAIGLTLPVLAVLIGFWWAVIAVEVAVFMLEAALLRASLPEVDLDRLGLVSLICNVASLTVGLALLA